MADTKKRNSCKLNNKGSALVVVIITIAFVCILATLLLYLSVMNYQMKSTDYRTKVSFYGAEVPLEELRLQLALDLSDAAKKAYKQVMSQYGALSVDLTNAEQLRNAEYQTAILDNMEAIWNTRSYDATNGTTNWVLGFSTALNNNSSYHVIDGTKTTVKCTNTSCTCPYHVILLDLSEISASARLVKNSDKGRVELHGIKVTYTADNGFSSVITTDFCIDVPRLDWSMNAVVYDTSLNKTNYVNEWIDGTSSNIREDFHYEDFVNYLNWTKQ